MPIQFAVKIVRLKVCMTFASPMTLTFMQSNLSASQTWLLFNLQYLGQYLSYYIQALHDGRRMHDRYIHDLLDDLDHNAVS